MGKEDINLIEKKLNWILRKYWIDNEEILENILEQITWVDITDKEIEDTKEELSKYEFKIKELKTHYDKYNKFQENLNSIKVKEYFDGFEEKMNENDINWKAVLEENIKKWKNEIKKLDLNNEKKYLSIDKINDYQDKLSSLKDNLAKEYLSIENDLENILAIKKEIDKHEYSASDTFSSIESRIIKENNISQSSIINKEVLIEELKNELRKKYNKSRRWNNRISVSTRRRWVSWRRRSWGWSRSRSRSRWWGGGRRRWRSWGRSRF